jgi:hypothetical protein
MNTKSTGNQRIFEGLSRHWQSNAEKMEGGVDRMASENERLNSADQQLIEGNKLLVLDRQNLQAVTEQADELETVIQKQTDRNCPVHSLLGKFSGSQNVKGNRQHSST